MGRRDLHVPTMLGLLRKYSLCSHRVRHSSRMFFNKTRMLFLETSKFIGPQIVPLNLHVKSSLWLRNYSTLPEADVLQITDEFRLVYEGPLTKSVRLIKLFSLSTAAASLMGGPVLVLFGKDSVSILGKVILASTVMLMGVSTTILLHWITKVYVHRMLFHPEKRIFAAETLSLFATTQTHFFSVEDVIVPEVESAFSTFQANGRKFFIHLELKEAEQILKYVREYNMETMESSKKQL